MKRKKISKTIKSIISANNSSQATLSASHVERLSNQQLMYVLLILLLLGGASLFWLVNFRLTKSLALAPAKEPVFDNDSPTPGKLAQWVNNCKITMPERYLSELKGDGRAAWIPLVNKQIKQIRSVLSKKAKSVRYQKILQRNEFEIEIVPQNDPRLMGRQETAPEARFIPSVDLTQEKHKILIIQDTDFSDVEIENTLANELHHLCTLTATLEKITDTRQLPSSKSMLLPFLDDSWKVDPVLREKHANSIKAAEKNVNEFRQLLLSNKKSAFFKEGEKRYQHYIQAFSDYQPAEFHQYVPRNGFETLTLVAESINNKLKVTFDDAVLYIHSFTHYGSETSIHYSYAASNKIADKANAFLRQFDSMRQQVYQGPYAQVSSEDEQDMEFSSFIDEFPQSIKNIFFSEWCDYFSSYTHERNYCR